MKPDITRGDMGEEVRKRMEMWKAKVDSAQRITEVSLDINIEGGRESRLAYGKRHIARR